MLLDRSTARAVRIRFLLVMAALVLCYPLLAGVASAQLPDPPVDLPGPIGEPTEEPDDPPSDDPGGGDDPTGSAPAPPGGGDEGDPEYAYYTGESSNVLPESVTSEFPPEVLCLVIPQTCSEDAEPITGPVEEGMQGGASGLDEGSRDSPEPVPDGELPVALNGGSLRYASALPLVPELPPAGEVIDEFVVTLHQGDLAYAVESPAFREFILAALVTYQTESPDQMGNALAQTASGETPPLTENITGVEVCPITTPFELGLDQPESELPVSDDQLIYCVGQQEIPEDGVWTFDLSFAAQDFADGFIDFHGVLIRPFGAENLAYGDADYSTNWYVGFQGPSGENPPTAAQRTGPAPEEPTFGSGSSGSGGSGGFSGGSSGSSGFGSGGSSGSTGGGSAPSTGGVAVGAPGAPGGTDVPLAEAGPAPAEGAAEDLFTAATADEGGSSDWLPWILIPMILGGTFWFGRVVDAEAPLSILRDGAMKRFLRTRGYAL